MDNNSPLISICIPTYNQVVYLRKTLDSVFSQKDVYMEVIISDDSSTNDVFNLVNEYVAIYPRINYFRNTPSLGSPANWNFAISRARGKYIKIMHHDDWFNTEFSLKKMLDLMCDREDILVVSATKIIRKNVEKDRLASAEFLRKVQLDNLELIKGNYFGTPSSILFARKNLQFFDEKLLWLVDVDYYIRLLKKCKLRYLNEPLFTTVLSDHNISNSCLYNTELNLEEYTYMYTKYLAEKSFVVRLKYFKAIYKNILISLPKRKTLVFFRLLNRFFIKKQRV